ncbi:MAG: hypothetical protein J5496_01255 [Lachnospiraceae bacterium]|nr:hypothetical protein [Lachnospiraceae bacterium]
MNEELVLCGANGDAEKYYFNPRYERLPEAVKEELQAALVLFAEHVGGTILIVFSEEGDPQLKVYPPADPIYYDEIEAGLEISRLQREKEMLFLQLKAFYLAFFGGEA